VKIVISGGTGFIGQNLTNFFISKGYEVVILTRNESTVKGDVKYIKWEPAEGKVSEKIEDVDVVINLAGFSIAAKRWSKPVKKELENSRIQSTKTIVKYLPEMGAKTFISASAVGYYGFRGDEIIDETFDHGNDFLSMLAANWENATKGAISEYTSILRFGVVIGENGGILQRFLTPVKYGLSKRIGTGKQWISWVDIDDVINSINYILEKKMSGVYNVTSPNPERNEDFMSTISDIVKRKQIISVPSFAIKILLGEMGEALILNGQRAIPKRLMDSGYVFKYPSLRSSLEKAVGKQD